MSPTLRIDNPERARASDADESVFAAACAAVANPSPAPECVPAKGIPHGTVTALAVEGVGVYPETRRDVRVYVPKQYDGSEPANLLVFQDGQFYLDKTFNVPAVLDNMIAAGALPPTIAVFIEPGDLIGYPAGGRHNRSFEYDRLEDAYVRLVLEDVLPVAISNLNISTDPARRAICGMSSGGSAAVLAAWHRPDQFGAAISHCGSFTNVRHAAVFPSMVRTEAKRPFRVFLQSGANDMNRVMGSWPVANFDMAAALKLRGYDYRLEFGQGGHTLHHGAAIFPQTLRWIWRVAD